MPLEGAEAVRVKEEPECEEDTQHEAEDTESEASAQPGHIQHEVKEEIELAIRADWYKELVTNEESVREAGAQTGHIKHEVKEESARAGLYPGHTGKGELVVGPEELHRPKVVLVHPATLHTAEKSAVTGRACSIVLEHMHVDLERRTCRVGPHTYKLRLCLSRLQDADTRRNTKVSRNKISRQTQQKEPRGRPKAYQCGQCSYASTNKGNLKIHEMIHTGHKPYKCQQCSFAAAHKDKLKIHQRIHTGEKPYRCGQCSYASTHKYILKIHEKIHTGEKPYYRCGQCSFASTTISKLKNHERIHTGGKPYKCGQCSYASARKGDLKTHERIHSGDKLQKCGRCSYASAQKGDLKIHGRKHTGDKPYKCGQCSGAETDRSPAARAGSGARHHVEHDHTYERREPAPGPGGTSTESRDS